MDLVLTRGREGPKSQNEADVICTRPRPLLGPCIISPRDQGDSRNLRLSGASARTVPVQGICTTRGRRTVHSCALPGLMMRKYLIPGPTKTTTRCIAELHDDGGEISAFRFGNVLSSPPPAPFFHGKGNYSHATDGRPFSMRGKLTSLHLGKQNSSLKSRLKSFFNSLLSSSYRSADISNQEILENPSK